MNILITGGTGFFGKALLRRYLANGFLDEHKITIMSRHPERFRNSYPALSEHRNLAFHPGDIMVPDSWPENKFSHVLHAATDAATGPNQDRITRFQQIVTGTLNMLDLAVHSGAQRFLLTSSGAVYGACPQRPLKESDACHVMPQLPSALYGLAKLSAEHLCQHYQMKYPLETVVARCFAFSGEDLPLHLHYAIGNFVQDALTAPSINITGDSTASRSYLDQDDLADWLTAVLLHGKAGEAYNIGSETPYTILQLAHCVRDVLSPGKPVIQSPYPTPSARGFYIPDTSKARQTLVLSEHVPLVESILKMAKQHCRPQEMESA